MKEDEVLALVQKEKGHFCPDGVWVELQKYLVPPRVTVRHWQYGPPYEHNCWIIAESPADDYFLVYCTTAFGPDFPWGLQRKSERNMGMDDVWYAYLYEAFIVSPLWTGEDPTGFTLMGPGERERL